jgi:hypothetical protein
MIFEKNRLAIESFNVCPGRAFLRRLIDLTLNVSNPFHKIRLNSEARADISLLPCCRNKTWFFHFSNDLPRFREIAQWETTLWWQSDNFASYLTNFACIVICPGRAFLRRLIDLTLNVSNPFHRIRLNSEARVDISTWKIFIETFNGKSVFLKDHWIISTTAMLSEYNMIFPFFKWSPQISRDSTMGNNSLMAIW